MPRILPCIVNAQWFGVTCARFLGAGTLLTRPLILFNLSVASTAMTSVTTAHFLLSSISFQNEITKNISPLFENFLYCSSTKKKWPWNSPTHQFYVMFPISPFIIYFLFTFFIKVTTSGYVSGGQCSESGSNKEDILLLLSTYVSGGQYSESGSNKEEILLLLSVLLMYKVCLGNTKQS